MQGIYTYIPETNCVPREYSVAAILLLLFMVLISLVSVLNLLYFTLVLSEVSVQCPIWLFSAVPWLRVFPVCCSRISWMTYYYYYYYVITIIRASTITYLTQIMFLRYIVLQLFCVYDIWCMLTVYPITNTLYFYADTFWSAWATLSVPVVCSSSVLSSQYVVSTFYELRRDGSSCPHYYWYHVCLYITPTFYFYCKVFIIIIIIIIIISYVIIILLCLR